MSECEGITELYRGEFVTCHLVDETIELTVANNVYSRSECSELLADLRNAMRVSGIEENIIDVQGLVDRFGLK